MNEKIKYIAITIGPIGETLSLVSKPAGLWGASYLFSYITEQLTAIIKTRLNYEILTPYFEFDKVEDSSYQASRGAGFYHDHIIVKNGDLKKIEAIIAEVKAELGKEIHSALSKIDNAADDTLVCSYINDYIRVYATEYTIEGNDTPIIKELSPLFDGMELRCQTVPVETENYIASFLDNDIIRESFLVKRLESKGSGSWQLFRNESDYGIKTLSAIAKGDGDPKKWKRYSYYAYVISDCDHMGIIISQLKRAEQIKEFSQNCLRYNTKACKCVEDFGGIVIYAGGDDLRFLAPLTKEENVISETGEILGTRQKTIFELVLDIKRCFNETFIQNNYLMTEDSPKPTISFGAAITYHKYPLYETGHMADSLLYEAKESGRDSLCIYMNKSSGQSAKYVIHNLSECDATSGILCDLNTVINSRINGKSLNTVMSHITQYTGLLDFGLLQMRQGNPVPLDCFFTNIFSEDTAFADPKVRNAIKKLTADTISGKENGLSDIVSLHGTFNTDEGRTIPDAVWPVIDLLRTAQLFGEEGDPRHV